MWITTVQRVINATGNSVNNAITDLPGITTRVFKLVDDVGEYRLTCDLESGEPRINNPRAWVEYFFNQNNASSALANRSEY